MRHFGFAALTSLIFAGPTALAKDEPSLIPQNPERQQQQYRDLIQWNRRTLEEAYEKVGKKNPRWDKPARAALEAAARLFGHAVDPCTTEEEVYSAAQSALSAGCDDPLILYVYARSSHIPNYPGPAEFARRMIAAGEALERSNYPPCRRALALSKAGLTKAQTDSTPEGRRDAARLLDAALALVPESAAKEVSDVEFEKKRFEVATQVLEGHHLLTKDYEAAFQRVDSVLAKSPALSLLRLQVKGHYLIQYAWEARGKGFANTVTEEGGRKYSERLAEADETLKKAWALKPEGEQTPNLMLIVVKGLGSERDEMETWFRRAMEADGNNAEACRLKMDWLDPKWHGSPEELLAFGRACRDTRNWAAGITLLLGEAHIRLAFRLDLDERAKYLGSKEVWDDIRSVNEEFLSHYTANFAQRNLFATYCSLCGRYAEADEQFQVIGEKLAANRYFTLDRMKQLRAYAAAKAKESRLANP